MERLTVKWTDKVYDTLDPVDILDNEYSKANYNKLLTKLGEYEDFEEIFREKMTDTACEFLKDKEEFGKWLDRNKWIAKKCDEYARAEEQGRLLLLPCNVGYTVWDNDYGKPCAYTITGFSLGTGEDYIDEPISEKEIVYYCSNSSGSITESFAAIEIGKTVFLTQTEAEQKLKETTHDNCKDEKL